jgi:hypothetical protein
MLILKNFVIMKNRLSIVFFIVAFYYVGMPTINYGFGLPFCALV